MPPRILVVDDCESVRVILELMLTQAGFEIVLAESGEEALEIAGRETVRGALLDIVMPGMNGFELCQRLQAQLKARGEEIPIWIMSANGTNENRQRAAKLGAVGFFEKPFVLQDVITAVQKRIGLCDGQ